MKERICLAVLAAAIVFVSGARAAGCAATCRVLDVEDSATLVVQCGDRSGVLRVPGIRAPRPGPPQLGGEPYAEESRRLAAELLTSGIVEIVGSRDGTELRFREENLGELLLRRGWAYLESVEAHSAPNLAAAERDARGRGSGVWSAEAWQELRDRVTEPVFLAPPRPPEKQPALGERSRTLVSKPWSERKAAFEEALRDLERN